MKKVIIIIIILIIFGVAWVLLRGEEDTWICENGEWVKHGAPSASKPTEPCGEEKELEEPDECEDQPNLIGLGFKDNKEANKIFVEENGKFKPLTDEEWQEQDYKWDCLTQYYAEEDIPGEVLNKFSESDFLTKAKADIEDWETYSNQELGIEFKYPAEWQIKESETGGKHIESRAPYESHSPILGPFVLWVDKSTAGANWGSIDDIKTITIKAKKILLITRGSAAPNNKIYYTVRISDESHSFYFKYTPSQQGSLGWTEDYHQSVFATILSTFKFIE